MVILHSFAKLPDGVVGFYITFRYLQDPEAFTETDVLEFRFAVHLAEPENQARCTNQLVIATRECLSRTPFRSRKLNDDRKPARKIPIDVKEKTNLYH